MLKTYIDKIPKQAWTVFAMSIVMLIVGPEFLAGMELMALVNLMGADIFVITTFTSIATFTIKPIYKNFIKFEKNSNFYIPTIEMITKNPTSLFFLFHSRTLTYVAFLFIFLALSIKTTPYLITLIVQL